MISTEDRLAIHELVALYGHIIDELELHRTPELFTEDAAYDVTATGGGRHIGAAAIATLWSDRSRHPLAHHATNVVITPRTTNIADYVYKGMGVGFRNRVGSLVYRGHCIRTANGWRFAEMVVTLREPPPRPDPVAESGGTEPGGRAAP
jgi:hypothetical protein